VSATDSNRIGLRHGRVAVVLHRLSEGAGTPLLLLHEWRRDARSWEGRFDSWAGPVYALDFAGHGDSDRLRGGAYAMELFVGDADAALAQIGDSAVVGAGSGAYVALLFAGARPESVCGALLLPGAGLEGGGAEPDFEHPTRPSRPGSGAVGPPDPWLPAAPRDVRPVDYAACFARAARQLLLAEDSGPRPPWWQAVARVDGVESVSEAQGLARLAALAAPETAAP